MAFELQFECSECLFLHEALTFCSVMLSIHHIIQRAPLVINGVADIDPICRHRPHLHFVLNADFLHEALKL